jgi:hypothetical protein
MKPIDLLSACRDAKLFRRWFHDPRSWQAWYAFLSALFALPMDDAQLQLYKTCTGRTSPPPLPVQEAWLAVGRRGGKSFILALIAVYLATFRNYQKYLQPGERATVMVIAVDRRQARVIFRFVRGLLTVPMLAKLVEHEGREHFDLANSISIEIMTASYKSVRGYTTVAALVDEISFFPSEDSAEPDVEVLDAIRPGMATIPGALLLCASSPYAMKGAMWETFKRHYGKDSPILFWKAASRVMNPTVSQSLVDAAIERDPASASSEWMAEFRSDLSAWIVRDALMACVSPHIFERAPQAGVRYGAFVDPSGGSSDSFTLAIGHREGHKAVIDAVREIIPPFSPEASVYEFCNLLRSYGIKTVTGDRYGGE